MKLVSVPEMGSKLSWTRTVLIDDSENIDRIWYNPLSLEMKVRFVSGRSYIYRNVEPKVFGTLVASQSVGSAFNVLKSKLTDFEEVKSE